MNSRAASRTYASIRVGDTASVRHRIVSKDVHAFSRLSGDKNPLHVEEKYAKTTQFEKRVVHGFYLGSLVSQLVGMKLPGTYALLMKETLEFRKPVFIGETVVVHASVAHKSDAAQLVELAVEIRCKNDVVASGSAHVRVLK
jgi:acyl dehydratase